MRISDWSSDVCSSDLLSDRKARCETDGRQHTLEPLACPLSVRGQFRRYDWRRCMGFGAGMAGDQADDPLDLRRIVAGAGVDTALAKPVEPQYPIRVHHDLEDRKSTRLNSSH